MKAAGREPELASVRAACSCRITSPAAMSWEAHSPQAMPGVALTSKGAMRHTNALTMSPSLSKRKTPGYRRELTLPSAPGAAHVRGVGGITGEGLEGESMSENGGVGPSACARAVA